MGRSNDENCAIDQRYDARYESETKVLAIAVGAGEPGNFLHSDELVPAANRLLQAGLITRRGDRVLLTKAGRGFVAMYLAGSISTGLYYELDYDGVKLFATAPNGAEFYAFGRRNYVRATHIPKTSDV